MLIRDSLWHIIHTFTILHEVKKEFVEIMAFHPNVTCYVLRSIVHVFSNANTCYENYRAMQLSSRNECTLFNESLVFIKISPKFIFGDPVGNESAMLQVMA